MQHSSHVGQIFKTEKTVEIQPVRPTEVRGKVLSDKNGLKAIAPFVCAHPRCAA